MNRIAKYLRERRKAELQTIHQFWLPGESVQGQRNELEARIADAVTKGEQLEERLSRLSRTQRALLSSVLAQPRFECDCRSVHAKLEAEGILSFEVDSAARMLQERGFLGLLRNNGSGRNRELYEVPVELAERIGRVFDVARRRVDSAHQVSQKRLEFEIDFDGDRLRDRIQKLESAPLRELTEIALTNRGVACPGVLGFDEACGEDGFQKAWARELEEAGVGTTGPVSLSDFGIVVDDPSIIIFQEWVQRCALDSLLDVSEPDTLLEAGVDLYVDLDRVVQYLEGDPQDLTREGRLPKRVQERIRNRLHLPRLEEQLEGDMTAAVVMVARRLGILECYADQMHVHAERLAVWRKMDLLRKSAILKKLFLEESSGARWSFHQESLRSILIEVIQEQQPEEWVSLDALVSLAVSTYMLELEEREVREILRQRREDDFARERLTSPFHRLGTDLMYWIVHRFLPLGACELGLEEGKLAALRLTALGKEILGLEREPRESRLLVNPDFEIILFSEGLRGMRMELELSRFGDRSSAERIRRYRVTSDSVQRGILSGLSLADMKDVLEEGSDHPLPEPVLVALRDWGKDMDWLEAVPAVVLRGLKKSRANELSQELKALKIPHQLCKNHSIVIVQDPDDTETQELLEKLRKQGWLIRSKERGLDLEEMSQQ